MEEKIQKNLYAQMDKNTVKADGQLRPSQLVRFENLEGKGKRILFVGNSITLHGTRPEIGWYGDWGMAATCKEKDYVHLTMEKIKGATNDPSFCICQVASWESHYQEGENCFESYTEAGKFGADLIILRLIENCPKNDFDQEIFLREIKKLLAFLDPQKKAKVLVTTGFWRHPGDEALENLAKALSAPLVPLGDLGERDEMKALGLFEHKGICAHPGDKGMEAISERIFDSIKTLL